MNELTDATVILETTMNIDTRQASDPLRLAVSIAEAIAKACEDLGEKPLECGFIYPLCFEMHMRVSAFNTVAQHTNPMVLSTLAPMISMGVEQYFSDMQISDDKWSVVTKKAIINPIYGKVVRVWGDEPEFLKIAIYKESLI